MNIKKLIFSLLRLKFSQCNVCNSVSTVFKDNSEHNNIACPNCDSLVKHRLLVAALENIDKLKKENLIQGKRVLHIKPERCLKTYLKKNCRQYDPVDLLFSDYSNVSETPKKHVSYLEKLDENMYDACIALDILECVPDYIKTLKDIYRIVKPGGFVILSVAQKDYLNTTIEYADITNPTEKLTINSQKDHVRIFGLDFKDMLMSVGFKIEIIDEYSFTIETVSKYRLYPLDFSLNKTVTNFRKVYFGEKHG